jgi:phosphatidylserine decarboxylase
VEIHRAVAGFLILAALAAGAWAFWRYYWFWRNPPRAPPPGDSVLSAADGTVVYVKMLVPGEDVINIKQGLAAKLSDIVREDLPTPKLLIGVFMSPFDVHYNRAPVTGTIEFLRHHPGHGANVDMGPMHRRILAGRKPYYTDSEHIVRNERAVTKLNGTLKGRSFPIYIVQIAAKTVAGIDSYCDVGETVERGSIFGMIRIGSQVDVVLPWHEGMQVRVKPGDRVRAGETVLVE